MTIHFVAFLLSCKYGLIWFLFISLSCGVPREYQNPLYSHKENRPLTLLPTSLLPIEHLYSFDITWRPTVLFPNALKGKYLVCTKEGPKVMRVPQRVSDGVFGRQGLLLEIAMVKTNSGDRARELREKYWLCLCSTLSCRRRQSGWQGWYSTKRFPRNLLRPWPGFLKIHSCSFILAFLYCHDHHSMSISIFTNKTLRDNVLSLRPCELNNFVLLLVSLWVLQSHPFKSDLSLLCNTPAFSLLSLEHVSQLVCRSSSIVAKAHVLTVLKSFE